MKKILMMLAAIFCCAMTTSAQETEGYTVDVIQMKKQTSALYGDNNDINPDMMYQGEGLHTGVIYSAIELNASKTDDNVKAPANPLFEVSFTDPYGRVPFYYADCKKISQLISKIKITKNSSTKLCPTLNINRGGQYIYRNYIPGFNYLYEETVNLTNGIWWQDDTRATSFLYFKRACSAQQNLYS